jgi:hypothetical protein
VSWRKMAGMILFLPNVIGSLVFVALIVVWKLPMICCERRCAIRYLPHVGWVYYGLGVPLRRCFVRMTTSLPSKSIHGTNACQPA